MKTKSLIETTPFLKDADMRKALIKRSVRSSCAVEGIKKKSDSAARIEIPVRKEKKIYKTVK